MVYLAVISYGLTEYFHVLLEVVVCVQHPRPTDIHRHGGIVVNFDQTVKELAAWDFIPEQAKRSPFYR